MNNFVRDGTGSAAVFRAICRSIRVLGVGEEISERAVP
jgi:hypothetical protein